MRKKNREIEQYRITAGPLGTTISAGNNGAFEVPNGRGSMLCAIASDGTDWNDSGLPGEPWEHVSVSIQGKLRCPTWEDMELIRKLFWGPDETVMQLHVPDSDHISYHDYCLHMWRPKHAEIPRPPAVCVGPVS